MGEAHRISRGCLALLVVAALHACATPAPRDRDALFAAALTLDRGADESAALAALGPPDRIVPREGDDDIELWRYDCVDASTGGATWLEVAIATAPQVDITAFRAAMAEARAAVPSPEGDEPRWSRSLASLVGEEVTADVRGALEGGGLFRQLDPSIERDARRLEDVLDAADRLLEHASRDDAPPARRVVRWIWMKPVAWPDDCRTHDGRATRAPGHAAVVRGAVTSRGVTRA